MKRADDPPRRSARSRTTCSTRTPDWRERMAAWEETVARRPAGVDASSGPTSTTISTGGQKYLPHGGRLVPAPRATRRRSTRVKMTVEDRRARRSPRSGSSCSTTRTCRCGGPGRSIKGTCALTEFEVEAAAGRRAGEEDARSRSSGRRPTSNPPETAPGADLRRQDGQASGSPGRSRSPSTARTRRPGASTPAPAGATRRARRSSSPRSRSRFPAGTVLTFHLKQNHGGWNSDDNQNNNLGRFRLSRHRRARTPTPTRCPRRVREILAVPRDRRIARAGRRPSSATGGRRSPSGRRRTTGSRRSGSSIPRASTQLVLAGARRAARRRTSSSAATSSSRASRSTPGVPAFLHPLPAGRAGRRG